MNEEAWLNCALPPRTVEFLRKRGQTSSRKFCLFACACVRRVWHHLADERSRRAIEIAEAFVEGQASVDQLFPATADAFEASGGRDSPAQMAAFVASCGGIIVPALAAWGASQAAAGSMASSFVARMGASHNGYVARDIGCAWTQGDADQEQNWNWLRFVASDFLPSHLGTLAQPGTSCSWLPHHRFAVGEGLSANIG
jgi:hypothetical protein